MTAERMDDHHMYEGSCGGFVGAGPIVMYGDSITNLRTGEVSRIDHQAKTHTLIAADGTGSTHPIGDDCDRVHHAI